MHSAAGWAVALAICSIAVSCKRGTPASEATKTEDQRPSVVRRDVADGGNDGRSARAPRMPASTTPRHRSFEAFARHYVETRAVVGPAVGGPNAGEPPEFTMDLDQPYMSRMDADGRLYVLEKGAQRIWRLDPDGNRRILTGSAAEDGGTEVGDARKLAHATGMVVMPDSRVFVYQRDDGRVLRIAADGGVRVWIDDPEPTAMARGLWVAPDESRAYLTAGERLRKFSLESGFETVAEGFVSLAAVDVDPDGRIFVSDRGANQVFEILTDGKKRLVAGNGTATGGGHGQPATSVGMHGARGLIALGGGALMVGTQHGGRIWLVDEAGRAHLIIDPHRASPVPGLSIPSGGFSKIRGLSLTTTGNILVTHGDRGGVHLIRHEF